LTLAARKNFMSLARQCEVFFARLHSPPAYAGGSERRRLRTLPAGKGEESANFKTGNELRHQFRWWLLAENYQPTAVTFIHLNQPTENKVKTARPRECGLAPGSFAESRPRGDIKVTYLFNWPAAQIALLLQPKPRFTPRGFLDTG
ncbi:MAG: hypothetical protein ACUVTH_14590, partial [Thermogutta sp.]